MMRQSFVFCFVFLLMSSYVTSEFVCKSETNVLSPSPELSRSEPLVLSPSPQPSNNDCSTVVYGMFDCLSFLSVGSTDLSPTKSCCDGVKTVLEYNPNCLCVALESSRDMGFNLINSRALAIPSTCKIPIDPHCVASPAPSTSTPPTSIISPSKPPKVLSPPTISPSKPSAPSSTPASSVITSPPTKSHASPVRTASPPKITHSSPATITPASVMVAPSPSISSVTNLSASKLFLAILITFSFAYV